MLELSWKNKKAGMMPNISARSREFSQEALQRVKEIKSKYTECPLYKNLSDEENALLLRKLSQIGNALAGARYKKYSFYTDAVKNARNIDAHSVKDDESVINKIYENVFSWLNQAEIEISRNIARAYSQDKDLRSFEKFGCALASEENRKQFVDSIQSTYNKGSFDAAFSESKDKILTDAGLSVFKPETPEQKELLYFAKSQSGLEISIQKDILEWTVNTHNLITQKNPFTEETQLIRKTETLSVDSIPGQLNSLESTYNSCESVKQFKPSIDFDFYKKAFAKNVSPDNKEKTNKEITKINEILARNLLSDMNKELLRRKTSWELEQIEEQRKQFILEFYKKIEKFKKLFELIKSLTKNFGRLWDLAQGDFQDNGFDILDHYGSLLQEDSGLSELAEMIGRHYEEEQRYYKELRSKILLATEYVPEPAYKGEICGIKLSDSITDALHSELALYNIPETRPLFKMKYAQKQILSYAYTRDISYRKETLITEETDISDSLESKGPMIICVDTSGSMQGTPERVAKTIAFALAKKSIEEERGCYLISFSTSIQTMDLTSLASLDGIINLVSFLKMSFNGGTDASPALLHSVKMLEKENWKNADVLVISDFVMDVLGKDTEDQINTQKTKGNRFFSLAVTTDGNENVISVFDKNWIYNTNSQNPGDKLIRQLEEINA